jgi:trehalose-6-phosphate synthase
MPTAARWARMRALRAHVFSHDVGRWASNFLDTMAEVPRDPAPTRPEPSRRPPERGSRARDAVDARP